MNDIKTITLVALLLVTTVVFPAQAFEIRCLEYEPPTVELTGTIKRVIFPGPPNYLMHSSNKILIIRVI